MDTARAAQIANVTADTIRTWARMGAVSATKTNGRWNIDAASLNRRIQRSTPTQKECTMIETDISIEIKDEALYLSAPFHRPANADYRGLGGDWKKQQRVWAFRARDLDQLRAVLRKHFGYDDRPYRPVDVRVILDGEYGRGHTDLDLFSRTLAHRPARDADVRLARGVRVVEGEFSGRSGSTQCPALGNLDGIVLEVRDVPAEHPDLTTGGPDEFKIQVMNTPDAPASGRSALEAERAQLVARLAEIDAQLAQQ